MSKASMVPFLTITMVNFRFLKFGFKETLKIPIPPLRPKEGNLPPQIHKKGESLFWYKRLSPFGSAFPW